MINLHSNGNTIVFVTAVAALAVAIALPGEATNWAEPGKVKTVRELGGAHAFLRTPIDNGADLQRYFVEQRADIEKVLTMVGWPGEHADLFAAVRDGEFEDMSFPVDGRLQWMAARRGGKKVDVIRDVQWGGKQTFPAFVIRFVSNDARWAFVVPKVCGNLSLYSKMGTGELTLTLDSGVAQLYDPEGNPITIRAGETGTVSAAWSGVYGENLGESNIPTEVGVSEGTVEFKEYGRPIAVMVAGGNAVSATLNPDGTMRLTVPEDNASPLPVKVGDAVGTLSAGAGMAADWTPPVCRLTVEPSGDCVPEDFVIDAGGSFVIGGEVKNVAVTAQLPDGQTVELGAPAKAGTFRWTKSFEQPGTYRFSAVAVSDKNRPSTNACAVELDVERCVPPPPTCSLTTSAAQIYAFERLKLDGSASSSNGGEIDAVIAGVYTESGRGRTIVEMEAPFSSDVEIPESGRFVVKAVAVDNYGQSSENTCQETVVVKSRNGFSGWAFAGFGSRQLDDAAVAADGWLAGFKATVDRRVSRGLEVSFGGGLAYQDIDDDELKLFLDLQIHWVQPKTFFGLGFGYWDLANRDAAGSTLFVNGGFNLPWTAGGNPVQIYGEGRVFLDELGGIGDNYIAVAGLRFRPW